MDKHNKNEMNYNESAKRFLNSLYGKNELLSGVIQDIPGFVYADTDTILCDPSPDQLSDIITLVKFVLSRKHTK